MKKYISIAMILSLNIGCALAASYDCSGGLTKVESIICQNDELSKMDDEMAGMYREALKKIPNAKALKVEQRDWLKMRNQCRPEDIWKDPPRSQGKDMTATECLYKVYEERVSQMEARYLQSSVNAVERLKAFDDVKVEGKDNVLCKSFLESVRKGEGVVEIKPEIDNATIREVFSHQGLTGCSVNNYIYSAVQEPRGWHGERLFVDVGRVWKAYDSYSLWLFYEEPPKQMALLYSNAKYFDIERSVVGGELYPYWTVGGGFTYIEQPGCDAVGRATSAYFPSGHNAPPLIRQSQVVKFNGKNYLLIAGNMAPSVKHPRYIVRMHSLTEKNIPKQCFYTENNMEGE